MLNRKPLKIRRGSFRVGKHVVEWAVDMRRLAGGTTFTMRDGGAFPTDWGLSIPSFLTTLNDNFWRRFAAFWRIRTTDWEVGHE